MKRSLALVIDASVLRSAGETDHPVSSACRECLKGVLTICHRAVSTQAIRDEYKRHWSRFSRIWYRSMVARRKVVNLSSTIRSGIDTTGLNVHEASALEKDVHLLEAALAADKVIVTRDVRLREILEKTRDGDRITRVITWIDPPTDGYRFLERAKA